MFKAIDLISRPVRQYDHPGTLRSSTIHSIFCGIDPSVHCPHPPTIAGSPCARLVFAAVPLNHTLIPGPGSEFALAVRCPINSDRTRCVAWMSCCSTDFTWTKRILGRLIASHIASASLASFLLLFTYGFTNCGAISFTLYPLASNKRPQWWAPVHASYLSHNPVRSSVTTPLTSSLASAAVAIPPVLCSQHRATGKTFFAKSTPIR